MSVTHWSRIWLPSTAASGRVQGSHSKGQASTRVRAHLWPRCSIDDQSLVHLGRPNWQPIICQLSSLGIVPGAHGLDAKWRPSCHLGTTLSLSLATMPMADWWPFLRLTFFTSGQLSGCTARRCSLDEQQIVRCAGGIFQSMFETGKVLPARKWLSQARARALAATAHSLCLVSPLPRRRAFLVSDSCSH